MIDAFISVASYASALLRWWCLVVYCVMFGSMVLREY